MLPVLTTRVADRPFPAVITLVVTSPAAFGARAAERCCAVPPVPPAAPIAGASTVDAAVVPGGAEGTASARESCDMPPDPPPAEPVDSGLGLLPTANAVTMIATANSAAPIARCSDSRLRQHSDLPGCGYRFDAATDFPFPALRAKIVVRSSTTTSTAPASTC